ncbi:MAG TPA: hypothetical protein VIW26_15490 [Gemmatimonadales bacterium]
MVFATRTSNKVSWPAFTRLERKFVLGFTDHVPLGYRQILLAHPLYSHCQLYIYARDSQFVLIVPEAEIFEDYAGPALESYADLVFVEERVRSLEKLATRLDIWPVRSDPDEWRAGIFASGP